MKIYENNGRQEKEAADVCRKLDGTVVTLWLENDGFDYPLQMDYERGWGQIVEAVREVADYAAGSEPSRPCRCLQIFSTNLKKIDL